MTLTADEIKAKIPPHLAARLRFLPDWIEPPGFRTLPAGLRSAMPYNGDRWKYTIPDTGYCWVWFGQYHRNKVASHNGKYVQRELYKLLIDPELKGKRLTNHFTNYSSDVNPYKCTPGMGDYTNHINTRATDNYHSQLAKFKGVLSDAEIAKCAAHIQDQGFDMFAPEDIRMFVVEEYSPPIIEAALKKLGKI
jgi:hypothetical protein